MDLNKLRDEIHSNSISHGWWDEERSFGDIVALCHSELSEALEEYRDGRPMVWFACREGSNAICNPEDSYDCSMFGRETLCGYRNAKPEGIAVELADCIIRILDYCGQAGIDVEEVIKIKHEYNKTRPYKHGGKVI